MWNPCSSLTFHIMRVRLGILGDSAVKTTKFAFNCCLTMQSVSMESATRTVAEAGAPYVVAVFKVCAL